MFYQLESPDHSRFLAKDDEARPNDEFFGCPRNPDHRWSKRRSDLSVVLPSPKNMRDFVWTWHSECLVQQHVIDILREEGLTGFEVAPVEAHYSKSTETPPRFWQLQVVGWGGVAPKATGVQFLGKCDACRGVFYSGLNIGASLIPPSAWDGSDFFFVWPYPVYMFVTERVKAVIDKHKLRGCQFTDPSLISMSPVFLQRDSRGTLDISHFLPEPRAREIGEPLGIWWPPQTEKPG